MTDVFISYSRRDIAFAHVLHDALKAKGLDTWIDWEDIPPSADWLAEVYAAIETTDTFVFVVSQTSIASEICNKEINHAVQNHKRLIPIVVQDVDTQTVPSVISAPNWIFFRQGKDDFQTSFDTLLKAVQTDLEWVKAHTRLQVRALEWEKHGREASYVLRGHDLRDAEQRLVGGSAEKNPQPTDLQRQYVLMCRRDADRRQRITLSGVIAGLVITAFLVIFAWTQRNQAVSAEQVRATAQANSVLEANARVTQEAIADFEASVSKIRLASQLSAQSLNVKDTQPDLALLLGLEACRYDDSFLSHNSLVAALQKFSSQKTFFLQVDAASVESLAFSPDGKQLISAGADGVKSYDIATHQPSGQLLTEAVSNIVIRPDGTILAAGQDKDVIKVWEATEQKLLFSYVSSGSVAGPYLNPDGEIVLTGSIDNNIYLRNWAEGISSPTWKLVGHKGLARTAAFSPNGKYVATADRENAVIIWDIKTHQPIAPPLFGSDHVYRMYSGVFALAFSPDSKWLAAASWDGNLYIWDISNAESGIRVLSFTEGLNYISSMAFSQDGKKLAIGGSIVTMWNVDAQGQLSSKSEISDLEGSVTSIAFSPDGRFLAVGSEDGKIILKDLKEGWGLYHYFSETGFVKAALSPDASILALANSQNMTFRNVATGLVISPPLISQPNTKSLRDIYDLVFSPNGEFLASIEGNRSYSPDYVSEIDSIVLWDVATQRQIGLPFHIQDRVNSLAFDPTNKILASGGEDKTIILWDIATGQPLGKPLVGHTSGLINDIIFSLDGKSLASNDRDRTIIVWDVASGQITCKFLTNPESYSQILAFSSDSKILMGSSIGPKLIGWNLSTCQPLSNLDGLDLASFNPPINRTIIPRSLDNQVGVVVTVWDWKADQALAEIKTQSGTSFVYEELSLDGKVLLEIDQQHYQEVLWNLDIENWKVLACETANRNLTQAEWKQYLGEIPYHKTCDSFPDG